MPVLGSPLLFPEDLAHNRCSIKACRGLDGARVSIHLHAAQQLGQTADGAGRSGGGGVLVPAQGSPT